MVNLNLKSLLSGYVWMNATMIHMPLVFQKLHQLLILVGVSDVVFGNELMRQSLDAIIHPAVKTYILEEIRKQRQAGCRLLVIEAALLLEEHYEEFCNNVWYIHTDAEIRIQRLMDSRGYTREKAESIIARQGSEEFFRKHSDYVIINNGDLKTTWKQIEEGIKLL